MGLESLPLVVFLLLPGFLMLLIFCWITSPQRKVSSTEHVFISLLMSMLILGISYPLLHFYRWITVNVFAASWEPASLPTYMQVLHNPKVFPAELGITIYVSAIIFGFLSGILYKSETIGRLFNYFGLDIYSREDVWYRLFRRSRWVTVYLMNGSIIAGWPTIFSKIEDKENFGLYLTKIHYYQKGEWVKPDTSVDGLLINADIISRVEFRKRKPIGGQPMKPNLIQWFEYCARFIVWIGGLSFAVLTVLGVIPILPPNTAIGLVLFLYLFLLAALITWIFDIYRSYPPRRRKAK